MIDTSTFDTVDMQSPDREVLGRNLAMRGADFTLVNFHYLHHIEFYNALKSEFGLHGRFDETRQQAWLSKRSLD